MRVSWLLVVVLSGCLAPKTLREVDSAVATEDWSRARNALAGALDKAPRQARLLDGQRYLDLVVQAREAVDSWQLEKALSLYAQAELAHPGTAYIDDQLAHARAVIEARKAMGRQDWSSARQDLNRSLRYRPQSEQAAILLGQLDALDRAEAALESEDWARATAEYRALVDPPVADYAGRQLRLVPHLRSAALALDALDWSAASEHLASARQIRPAPQVERLSDHVEAMLATTRSLSASAWEQSLQDLERAASTRPGTDYVQAGLSLATPMDQAEKLLARERYTDAIVYLDRALADNPRVPVVDRRLAYARAMGQGQAAVAVQDWRAARTHYLGAQRVERNDAVAAAQLAFVEAMAQGEQRIAGRRWREAVQAYEAALALRPGDALATRGRDFAAALDDADAKERSRDWRGALAAYQRADGLVPGNAFVQQRLARVQGSAVDEATGSALAAARSGDFRGALDELRFASSQVDASAPAERRASLDATFQQVSGLMATALDLLIGSRRIEQGYGLAVLARQALDPGERWVIDGLRRLRALQTDGAWALAERGEYERGLVSLDLIERFEPDQRPYVDENRLRMRRSWAGEITREGLTYRDYPGTLAALSDVLSVDPRLEGDWQALDGQVRVAWAGDLRDEAEARARETGPALALTARAVEVAGLPQDLAALDRQLARVRNQGELAVSLEVIGEPWRSEVVGASVQHRLRTLPGVIQPRGPRADAALLVDASRYRCEEGEQTVERLIKDAAGATVVGYPVRTVTRTCTGELGLALDGEATRWISGAASTSDETHEGLAAHGISPDPLRLTVDDRTLVRDVDAALERDLVTELDRTLEARWRLTASGLVQQLRRDPDGALGPLIGVALVRPDLVDRDTVRRLQQVLRERYGLESPAAIVGR